MTPAQRPYLIATIGFPGSGKTYFSENLSKAEGFIHLNADRERLELFSPPQYTVDEHQALSKEMDKMAEGYLCDGKSVIYDVNFNKRVHRTRIEELARRTGAEYRLVHIVTSPDIALERLLIRGKDGKQDPELYRPINLDIFHKMKDELEYPDDTEEVIRIDGEGSFDLQYMQLKESLLNAR